MRSIALVTVLAGLSCQRLHGQGLWTEWGGDTRDHRVSAFPYSNTWDPDGPPLVWKYAIDGGHGGVVVNDKQLFCLVRSERQEVAIAVDRISGAELWKHAYPVPDIELDYGMGPFGTPLIDNDLVIFPGGTGILSCQHVSDGTLVWRRDLWNEFPGSRDKRGFACSPLKFGDRLIVIVGAPDAAVVALNIRDGTTLWAKHDFGADYTSPILLEVEGQKQIICQMEECVVGLEPNDGRLLWSLPSRFQTTRHVISPINLGDGDVLVGTTYQVRRLRVSERSAEVVWSSRRIRSQVGNLLYLPESKLVLGASAASTGSPIVALDSETGDVLWRDRGLDCGFLVASGQRVFCLAPDGDLFQASVTRDGLTRLGKCRPFRETKVWSAPALQKELLYIKSQREIKALDLTATEP